MARNNVNKPTVMFLLHYSDLNNGAVRSMVDVIVPLVQTGKINAIVIYPDKKHSAIDYLESHGVPSYHVPYGRWCEQFQKNVFKNIKITLRQTILFLRGVFSLPRMRKIMSDNHVDVIYSNTITIYYGALLRKLTGVRHIWHVREFGKEDHDLKYLIPENTVHAIINKYTDLVIYISNSIRQKYEEYIHVPRECVIYNDISAEFMNYHKILTHQLPIELCVIGSVQPGKGQLEAIKAVQLVNRGSIHVRLHIAGNPNSDYAQLLKQYVSDNGLDQTVIFDGFIRDTNKYRSRMDIGLVTSEREAFGRVTVEGMLSGLLMIGANSAGTAELIKDGGTGYLYHQGSELSLAQVISKAINNGDQSISIAKAGYTYAKVSFCMHEAAKNIYNDILKLMNEG